MSSSKRNLISGKISEPSLSPPFLESKFNFKNISPKPPMQRPQVWFLNPWPWHFQNECAQLSRILNTPSFVQSIFTMINWNNTVTRSRRSQTDVEMKPWLEWWDCGQCFYWVHSWFRKKKKKFHCLFLVFFIEMTLFLEYKLIRFIFRIAITFQYPRDLWFHVFQ